MDKTELTLPELDAAREAGASPEFLTVAAFAPSDAGAKRNGPAVEVRKRLSNPPSAADLSETETLGGDFTGNLWDGKLGSAFINADIDHIRLLSAVFSQRYLIERVIEDESMGPDYAARLVGERIAEHTNAGPTTVTGP